MPVKPIRHIAFALLALLLASAGRSAAPAASGAPEPADPAATGASPAAAGAAPAASAAERSGIDSLLAAKASGADFLPAEEAFRLDALADGTDRVRLNWEIAEGYYLYRARIKVATLSAAVQLGPPQFPAGEVKNDEYFGRQEVYHRELIVTVPVARTRGGTLQLPLKVTYQGCADAGLCYPPITHTLTVTLRASASAPAPPSASATGGIPGAAGAVDQGWFAALIRTGNLFVMLGSFYLAGLLLSCTPCVLPMVPILSGIIAGAGRLTTARAFALSLTYVLGMALAYTLAGIACAAAGRQVQAVFQQWWVIASFAALFVALGLSMLGLFALQMPVGLQTRIANLSSRQSAGTFTGVAVMGALSALIVTTCVAPALVGALLVISQTGEVARGGAALFVMALGMGTPLLVVGASAGKLLPKAGPWMELVKKLFGVMMLAVAAWMLSRIVPDRIALMLWAAPALLLGWLLWSETRAASASGWTLRALGVVAALYGVALAAGSALGGTDPLAPLPAFATKAQSLPFRTIKTLGDLDREVARARAEHRGVLVDFSAEWCTSCKEMERYTFTDPGVRAALDGALLLRADVTNNDADDQALLRHFGIFGPPTIAFYGSDGRERAAYRVVGYMKADAFAARSRAALHAAS
jgi:thioredoxin:protein disulfide reductase